MPYKGLWPYHNTIDVVLLLAVSAFAVKVFKWLYSLSNAVEQMLESE